MSLKTQPITQTLAVPLSNLDKGSVALGTQDDHLSSLKALTEKLRLDTKRPSYLEWRFQLESQRSKGLERSVAAKEGHIQAWSSLKWTKSPFDFSVNKGQRLPERLKGFEGMAVALEWLKKELTEMQMQDQQLALQLMRLHTKLNRLKIEQACKQHRKMLNEATFELEERDEMLDVLCDFPVSSGFGLSTSLKLMGITKMNLSSRRFSLC